MHMYRHGIGQRTKKTENILRRETPLLLIKATRQPNFEQHLSLFFHHLCILHSHLFLTPFSDTYTKNIFIIFRVALCIERRKNIKPVLDDLEKWS